MQADDWVLDEKALQQNAAGGEQRALEDPVERERRAIEAAVAEEREASREELRQFSETARTEEASRQLERDNALINGVPSRPFVCCSPLPTPDRCASRTVSVAVAKSTRPPWLGPNHHPRELELTHMPLLSTDPRVYLGFPTAMRHRDALSFSRLVAATQPFALPSARTAPSTGRRSARSARSTPLSARDLNVCTSIYSWSYAQL